MGRIEDDIANGSGIGLVIETWKETLSVQIIDFDVADHVFAFEPGVGHKFSNPSIRGKIAFGSSLSK